MKIKKLPCWYNKTGNDLETSEVLSVACFYINKERLLFCLQR
ncbi:hypothetical protein HMPREF0658_0009 [Hoylesella marshii DSM 16973 = JCM 13450]|uniref:Uncharacterized protein n=1 Tax=Hoylesella marshii DSM 16973 = JCM 13450 TaxID=862515 RepID=E0NPA8_9BACT|nr:hypothetical protein HMPREF0658_0009 [Hoylesella marshii DSM 16973 = JCM 13450]